MSFQALDIVAPFRELRRTNPALHGQGNGEGIGCGQARLAKED